LFEREAVHMLPSERIPYSAITHRPPLKLPADARLVVWVIVNVEEWNPLEPMPRTVLTPPAGASHPGIGMERGRHSQRALGRLADRDDGDLSGSIRHVDVIEDVRVLPLDLRHLSAQRDLVVDVVSRSHAVMCEHGEAAEDKADEESEQRTS
jgi:hypothetical protein